jgi:hypothetical protein
MLGHLPIALRQFAADFPRTQPFAHCAATIRRRFKSRSAICRLRCSNLPPISLALGHLLIALRPFAADLTRARPFAHCAAAIRRRFPSCLAICRYASQFFIALSQLPVSRRNFLSHSANCRYCTSIPALHGHSPLLPSVDALVLRTLNCVLLEAISFLSQRHSHFYCVEAIHATVR